jgi:hypothetical protein
MKRNENIQVELQQHGNMLGDIPLVNVYTTPPQYFEELHQIILQKIKTAHTHFEVPANYFDNLSTAILNKIKTGENELTEVAPTLAQMPKVNVYTTPKGYFDNLDIKEQLAPVVDLKPVRKLTWIKYAAVACIVAIVSITAFNYFDKTTVAKEDQIVAGTNFTYKELQKVNVDEELEKIDKTDLDNYLCESGFVACNDKIQEADLQKELDNLDVTEEDLNEFLNDPNN